MAERPGIVGAHARAMTAFVHPALVEAAARAGLPTEPLARNVVRSLVAAFKAGVACGETAQPREGARRGART